MLKSELRSVAVPPAEGKTGETTLDIKEDKKHHQVEKAESRDIFRELETSRHEMQRLLEGIEKRNMLLKSLGIFEDNDGTPDEESLFRIAKEKKESLEANENRLRQLEGENAERQEKISNLEIENAKMKDDIATRLNEHYVEGVQPSFQSLLDDKQGEIRYWREAFHNNDKVKTIKDLNRLNEEKDAELSELRPLPEKISELEQALREASEQIEIVQQEKEDQNLADRRRWDSEKEELEADLEEAEKSAEQLKEILELQPDPATNKQHVERLTAEIDAIRNEATELQRQADNMAEMITDVVEDSEKFRQERDELEEALQKLQNEKEADEKN
jgi:chromosome segregation ATPase